MTNDVYCPPSESAGGWRIGDLPALEIDVDRLNDAIRYHDTHDVLTKRYGGALVIIYQGHIVGESYVTGWQGGPQPWTAVTCNDMKSSTKSLFGTAAGVFLDEFKGRINLDTLLVGNGRNHSLIPQIWDQPLTDERKKQIKIKHVLSMTSGHASAEPWLAPSSRHHYPGYTGAFQMHEYCFGWWHFDGVPAHHTLLFEPGSEFNYSNFGLEQLALTMRNLTGEEVGTYTYERVLKQLGFPIDVRDNQYKTMPYQDDRELNSSDKPGWGRGGSEGCNAYGADKSHSPYGYNAIVGSTFRCTARDFARLGYLWLQKGHWGTQQLVPQAWMEQATRRFVRDNGESPTNYGYTFWIQDEWEGVPSDTFMSRGHNLNHCAVMPSLDLVIVRQGNKTHTRDANTLFTKTLLQKIVAAMPRKE